MTNKIKLEGCELCPACRNQSVPIVRKDSEVYERICQNPDCRTIVDRDGRVVTRMSISKYKNFKNKSYSK